VLIATLDDPVKGLATLIYILVYQQVENYFFSPRITAKTMSLHPAIAFGTVIVGGSLAGGIGALLALPAAAVLQAIGSTYVRRHELIESELFDEQVQEEPEGPGLVERMRARRENFRTRLKRPDS
jgi:predicted PurR-regulated permease PerM